MILIYYKNICSKFFFNSLTYIVKYDYLTELHKFTLLHATFLREKLFEAFTKSRVLDPI